MGIRILVNKDKKFVGFPKFMQLACGAIIQMISATEGTVINGSISTSLGIHSTSWDSSGFIDYNHSITLQNE
jgi:hypothetical protein